MRRTLSELLQDVIVHFIDRREGEAFLGEGQLVEMTAAIKYSMDLLRFLAECESPRWRLDRGSPLPKPSSDADCLSVTYENLVNRMKVMANLNPIMYSESHKGVILVRLRLEDQLYDLRFQLEIGAKDSFLALDRQMKVKNTGETHT